MESPCWSALATLKLFAVQIFDAPIELRVWVFQKPKFLDGDACKISAVTWRSRDDMVVGEVESAVTSMIHSLTMPMKGLPSLADRDSVHESD